MSGSGAVANAQFGGDAGEGDLKGLDSDYMADELAGRHNISDFNCPEELTNSTVPLVQIASIYPSEGPTTGDTRVEVRGCPFKKWEEKYKHPKCKFGDVVVPAAYATMPETPVSIFAKEAKGAERTHKGIQCENAPAVDTPGQVEFCISLTGDFNDTVTCVKYTYYEPTRVIAFNPRYGPKDGETVVKVWGQNFKAYREGQATCGFGTRAVPAKIYNSTYIECESPKSDVVEKPIPFTVSLNNQQNSKDTLWFYYYNWPQVEQIIPNRGPESGGTHIEVKGRSFFPFKDQLDEIDNLNETFCGFIDIKAKVAAKVWTSNKIECVAPPSYLWHKSALEITLND